VTTRFLILLCVNLPAWGSYTYLDANADDHQRTTMNTEWLERGLLWEFADSGEQ
jgi:hypothetical protein